MHLPGIMALQKWSVNQLKKIMEQRLNSEFSGIWQKFIMIVLKQNSWKLFFPYTHRCKFRVLDSFGTEAEFNYDGYKEKIPGGRSAGWADHNLLLQQFLTLFREYKLKLYFFSLGHADSHLVLQLTVDRKAFSVIWRGTSTCLNIK